MSWTSDLSAEAMETCASACNMERIKKANQTEIAYKCMTMYYCMHHSLVKKHEIPWTYFMDLKIAYSVSFNLINMKGSKLKTSLSLSHRLAADDEATGARQANSCNSAGG